MLRFCFSLCAMLAVALSSHAGEPPHPKLVVVIAVDQFSSNIFNEYRPLYKSGLARLAGGAVFPRGHQSHAATETCPGHSTILTGARPARTGIVANEWFDPSRPRTYRGEQTYAVYCVEQPGPAGSEIARTIISADSLLVPTLGDRMKAHDANTRVVAVSGKDRAAVMLGGHHADVTLWWTPEGYETYDGKEATIPRQVATKVNADIRKSYGQPMVQKLPPACAAKSQSIKLSDTVSVGTLRKVDANSKRWRATPAMDAFTVDVALAAMKDRELGKRDAIDLLAVSLSATDYAGHYYGSEGAEMCAQQFALDETIGRLLTALDKTGVPYVVALTADHGVLDTPERNRLRGVPDAQRLSVDLLPMNMSAALASELQLPEPVVLGTTEFANDVYLSAAIAADRREAALHAAVLKYRSHAQVAAVFTRNEIIAAEPPGGPADEWTLLDRAKASFNPHRSGDLIVLLKPYVTTYPTPKNPESHYSSSHGSPWGYDRRVPVLFWWRGMTGFEQPAAVETVDIAPTLAKLIGLDVPASEFDGRPLDVVVP